MNITCDTAKGGCGSKFAMTDERLDDFRKAVEKNESRPCPNPGCKRVIASGAIRALVHHIDRIHGRPGLWPGFPHPKPVVPPGRRKNGAAPGVDFMELASAPLDREPTEAEIKRVQRYFARQLDEGSDCLCCTRYAQRQRRTLGCGPARWLMEIVYLSDKGQPIHTGTVLKNLKGNNISGSDATSVLPLYGMIEAAANPNASKNPPPPSATGLAKARTSGFWKPTSLGRDFVFDKVKVPAKVITCLGNPEAFEGEPVTIREALGKKFNYDELRSRRRGSG